MIKVSIIECEDTNDLEEAINKEIKFISRYSEIVDIKYSGSGYSVPYGTSNVSAMIIYRDK